MKLGHLQIYNEIDWASNCIDQAMRLCDKLIITEGSQFASFSDIPERSTDGTLDVINDKISEYPGRIQLLNTFRKFNNYRKNQCANFNRAITFCSIGDYFISLDSDEFYFDDHIDRLNLIMKENTADVIGSYGYTFAFGFKWRLINKKLPMTGKKHILKKTKDMYFIPTHKPKNIGSVEILNKEFLGRFHYKWVKPTDRMRIRHRTSGFYKGMLKWFDNNWDNIKLVDGKTYDYYGGSFSLKRYDGKHPEILKEHKWVDVEDVRKCD